MAPLRRGNRPLALASVAYHRRHDWLFPRRGYRYALLRHAHHCYGICCLDHWSHSQRKFAYSSAHSMARPYFLRVFPWPRRSRKGSRCHHSFWRRRSSLGGPHQTLARRLSLSSSRRHRQLLPHSASLLRALFPPSSTTSNASSLPNSSTSGLSGFTSLSSSLLFFLGRCSWRPSKLTRSAIGQIAVHLLRHFFSSSPGRSFLSCSSPSPNPSFPATFSRRCRRSSFCSPMWWDATREPTSALLVGHCSPQLRYCSWLA